MEQKYTNSTLTKKMKTLKLFPLTIYLVFTVFLCCASTVVFGKNKTETYTNPLKTADGDTLRFGDPFMYKYGDTYYTDETIINIISKKVEDILFFGNKKSIVAIKIKDSNLFKKHIENVKQLYLKNKIKNCKGWQVYQSFQNLQFDIKQIKDKFIIVDNDTIDYNTPKEYENRKQNKVDDKK